MTPLQDIPKEAYEIIKELTDGYIIKYCKTYVYNVNEKVCISLKIRVSVDEMYYLQNESDEDMNKFKDRLGEALGHYIRRNIL